MGGVQGQGEEEASLGVRGGTRWKRVRPCCGPGDETRPPYTGGAQGGSRPVRRWRALGSQRARKTRPLLSKRTTVQWRRSNRPQEVMEGGDSCCGRGGAQPGSRSGKQRERRGLIPQGKGAPRLPLPQPHTPLPPARPGHLPPPCAAAMPAHPLCLFLAPCRAQQIVVNPALVLELTARRYPTSIVLSDFCLLKDIECQAAAGSMCLRGPGGTWGVIVL